MGWNWLAGLSSWLDCTWLGKGVGKGGHPGFNIAVGNKYSTGAWINVRANQNKICTPNYILMWKLFVTERLYSTTE